MYACYKKQTPTDSPATGSYMHPTGPKYTEYRQTHTLDGATAVAREVVLRLSLFAVTTLLSREPAFTGAGPCLKRGQRQHADGRLVSTRSCSLHPCARCHCGWHALVRLQGHRCATAVAQL